MNHEEAAKKIIGEVFRTADMFQDDLPNARKNDPITSKVAAIRYNAEKRGDDKKLILDLVTRYPGHTAAELSAILLTDFGVHWYRAARMTTKRLSDIKHQIKIGPNRKCRQTRDFARTYYPLDDVVETVQ